MAYKVLMILAILLLAKFIDAQMGGGYGMDGYGYQQPMGGNYMPRMMGYGYPMSYMMMPNYPNNNMRNGYGMGMWG